MHNLKLVGQRRKGGVAPCKVLTQTTQPLEISYIARKHFYYIRAIFCAKTTQKTAQMANLRLV